MGFEISMCVCLGLTGGSATEGGWFGLYTCGFVWVCVVGDVRIERRMGMGMFGLVWSLRRCCRYAVVVQTT